jgi:hypothetical protein
VVLVGYALGVAAFDWHDVTAVAGRRYGVGEYAPAAQATTDALRRHWRRDDARLRDTTIGVIVHEPFPLEPLYQEASRDHGVELRFVDSVAFCRDPVRTISDLFAATCGRIAVALPARLCPARWGQRLGWPPSRARDGTALYLFDAPCLSTADRDWSAPEVLDLAQ